MRHGESGFKKGQKDFDRCLTQKGINDVQKVGKNLLKAIDFDLVLCSAANRTKQTFERLNINQKVISYEKEIYEASLQTILKYICELKGERVLYIGHNPGVTELTKYLSGYPLVGMTPGSVAKVVCALDNWEMSSQDLFQLEWYRSPEMF